MLQIFVNMLIMGELQWQPVCFSKLVLQLILHLIIMHGNRVFFYCISGMRVWGVDNQVLRNLVILMVFPGIYIWWSLWVEDWVGRCHRSQRRSPTYLAGQPCSRIWKNRCPLIVWTQSFRNKNMNTQSSTLYLLLFYGSILFFLENFRSKSLCLFW